MREIIFHPSENVQKLQEKYTQLPFYNTPEVLSNTC